MKVKSNIVKIKYKEKKPTNFDEFLEIVHNDKIQLNIIMVHSLQKYFQSQSNKIKRKI